MDACGSARMIEDQEHKRDSGGLSYFTCEDCGKERPDYLAYERRGKLYCGDCVCSTAERKAYELRFVRPRPSSPSA